MVKPLLKYLGTDTPKQSQPSKKNYCYIATIYTKGCAYK